MTPNPPLRKARTWATLVFGGGCLVAAYVVLWLGFSEAYVPLLPGIDTRFAPGFTEARFDRVALGMDAAQVRAVLGEPLSRGADAGEPAVWSYTGDGQCRWLGLDFAWLGRQVWFDRRGKVSARTRSIYYD